MLPWNLLAYYISVMTILFLKDFLWCKHNLGRCPKGLLFQHKAFLSVILCLVIKSVHFFNFFFFLNFHIGFRFYHIGLWWFISLFENVVKFFSHFPGGTGDHQIFSLLCLSGLTSIFYVTEIICSSIVCQIKQEICVSLSSLR